MPEPVGEGDLTDQWTRFKKEFGLFLTAIGKGDSASAVKLAIFLRVAGQRINDMHEALVFGEGEDKEDYATVIKKLDAQCVRRTSRHVIRDRFFQMKQEQRTVDQFVADLRKNVKDCNFGALKDDLMLLDNERMRRRLFETDKLELAKAIQMCQSMEATLADLQQWTVKKPVGEEMVAEIETGERKGSEEVAAMNKGLFRKAETKLNREDRRGAEGSECSRCGTFHRPRQCPAYGQRCAKCHQLNHFARKCHAKERTHLVSTYQEDILSVTVRKVGKKLLGTLQFAMKKGRVALQCQLDTAATCNVLSLKDHRTLGEPPLERSATTLTMYDGSIQRSLGRCFLQVLDPEEQTQTLLFEVLKSEHHSLLSLDTCLTLKLLTYKPEEVSVVNSGCKITKQQILSQFADLFTGVRCLSGEYGIDLDEKVLPVQNRPRKIPHTMRAAVESKLVQLEHAGVIASVNQPTDWISNITTVWKPDKKQVRICLDPRDLNKAIRRNHFNMPTIDDVLPNLKEAKLFSLLDAKDGFLQIKLSERSSLLTTFWGPQGRYRWLRLPSGVSSAPEEFQQRLQQALHGLTGVAVVADDIQVYGMEEARLNQLLDRARDQHLKLNKDKMRLHLTEVLYIGHVISAKGIQPDPSKVEGICGMPEPKGPVDVRRYLGMCNYLARYIPKLSEESEPLRKLTESDSEFKWGEKEKQAFQNLKDLIAKQQLLAFYDVRKPVVLQCDASTECLGATLLQEGCPVASVSRSLTRSERNYVALELECLAIVFACQKFDQYIFGKHIRVETDHKPLEIIIKKSILAAPKRLQRMLLQLQRYSLDVVYRPGEQQVVADTLSRAPLSQTATEWTPDEVVFQLQDIKESEYIPISDQCIADVRKAGLQDEEQMALRKVITLGWPSVISHVPEVVRSYWNFRDTMTVQDGIVYKAGQVVIR